MWLLAVILGLFALQPFYLTDGSMLPTLLVGDHVAVATDAYEDGRVPERGDIVVFEVPRQPTIHHLKRIVGLPGDRIQVIKSVLHVNGAPVQRERMNDMVIELGDRSEWQVPQYREEVPGGRSYRTLDVTPEGPLDDTAVFEVKTGHYFVMGDNRDNSSDSRVTIGVGQVPARNIVGRVEWVYYSRGEPDGIRWQRLFKSVQEF